MQTKVKMSEVVGAFNAINAMDGVTMPIKTSVAICILEEKLKTHVKVFEKENKKLMELHCEKDENGGLVASDKGGFKLANPKEYHEGVDELSETEVTVDFEPIDLGNIEVPFAVVKLLKKFMVIPNDE